MEPEDGRFDWDWLDHAIETLAAAGLEIVLGTPTAAPPAWLMHAYPDVLPVDAGGRTWDSARGGTPAPPARRIAGTASALCRAWPSAMGATPR